MGAPEPVRYYDRASGEVAEELVYGDSGVRFLYGGPFGRLLCHQVMARSLVSKIVGRYHDSRMSRAKINSFVRKFKIPMEQYQAEEFRSFNDFFVRRFRSGLRDFARNSGEFPAFAEARYLAFESVRPELTYPVKGDDLTPHAILGKEDHARTFAGGPALIARLCPVDYHRYHYPDAGMTLDRYSIPGRLHSVNPHALKARSDIFATNERRVAILRTENFGKLAYVEVGALCVGKIVQSHAEDRPFARGDEKGYFLFGASTVVVFGEPGRWLPDEDLLSRTRERMETLVLLGTRIGAVSG